MYGRWADWGTINGVTDYSFICITAETPMVNNSVVMPFYVEYLYLVSLVLAQRISLMKYSVRADQIADLIHSSNKKSKSIRKEQAQRWIDLQESYIVMKNRMMLLEATSQEQGIELYRLLQKQLMVPEEQAILDDQLQGLYDAINSNRDAKIAKQSLYWAIAAGILGVIALIDPVFTLLDRFVWTVTP